MRARLNPTGYYLISTAMFDPDRQYDEPFDEQTGTVYSQLEGTALQYREVRGARLIGGGWYLPHRRHLKPEALAAELQNAGFHVLWQGGHHGGDVACTLADDARLLGLNLVPRSRCD